MTAGQLIAPEIEGLEIPLVRARTLQEGAYTALEALNGHDVHHPLPTAQGDRQARLRKHSDSPDDPIIKHDTAVACRLYGTHQLRQVQLERIFENRHSGYLGFSH